MTMIMTVGRCCLWYRQRFAQGHDALADFKLQYHDDTALQRELHQKLHSYQMLRALFMGFMPSTEQLIINLRSLLSADILNPEQIELSDTGRLLVKFTKQWLHEFIDLLNHKNNQDQIQDFIWYISKARISIDVEDIARRTTQSRARADTAAAYRSLQTVGSLLLTNSDFRILLADLTTVGREVFKDTAFALSEAAEQAAKRVAPPEAEQKTLKEPGVDAGSAPSTDELNSQVTEVAKEVGSGAIKVTEEAQNSLMNKFQGSEGDTLLFRLKKTVSNLRHKRDYNDSVGVLAKLLQRYALIYSRTVEDAINTLGSDLEPNPKMEKAVTNFWAFISTFGEKEEWNKLETSFHNVLQHSHRDPEFENLLVDAGNSLQKLLLDPDFFEHVPEKFQELRNKAQGVGHETSLRRDMDVFFSQAQVTLEAVTRDQDIAKLIQSTIRIWNLLSPTHTHINGEIIQDAINVFLPFVIQAIQYIPIPRLEISTPEIDMLLENLIIEPGRTINHTSFLPFRFRVETYNDFELRKARFRVASSVTSKLTIKIDGLSFRADEVGFLLRAHTGLLRLADEGIASFQLDERGIDIHLDVEIAKEKMEQILSLSAVRVHIHKLSYTLRQSKFSFLGWLFKPLLRPVIRKVMEKQLAQGIADAIHAANRELLFARERLRATRISDPNDLATFVKAVLTRLTPEDDPDLYTRIGVAPPSAGVFKGRYAPGSITKLWEEEGRRAPERINEWDEGGWRNEVFDLHTMVLT